MVKQNILRLHKRRRRDDSDLELLLLKKFDDLGIPQEKLPTIGELIDANKTYSQTQQLSDKAKNFYIYIKTVYRGRGKSQILRQSQLLGKIIERMGMSTDSLTRDQLGIYNSISQYIETWQKNKPKIRIDDG